MTDEALKDLVIAHDKHIDIMAKSIENLASAVSTTTRKLDDVIDVITQQNVLMEKFNNLEANLKESFDRVHAKVQGLEDIQATSGCMALANARKEIEKTGQERLFRGLGIAFTGMILLAGWVLTEIYQNKKLINTHLEADATTVTELYVYIDELKGKYQSDRELFQHRLKELEEKRNEK